MIQSNPSISILMPVYRPNLSWLEESLSSLARQSYVKWKLIMSFDGVDELTNEASGLAISLLSKSNEVTIVKGEHVGIVGCLNRGLAFCDTTYTARMDVDDICLESRFTKQIKAFEEDSSLVACGTQIVAIDSSGNRLATRAHQYPVTEFKTLLIGSCFNTPFAHPTVVFRTDTAKMIGGYADCRCMEDYDLGSRLSRVGTVKNLPSVELYYRIHSNQHSKKVRPRRSDLLSTRLRYIETLKTKYGQELILIALIPFILWLMSPTGEYLLRRTGGRIFALLRRH